MGGIETASTVFTILGTVVSLVSFLAVVYLYDQIGFSKNLRNIARSEDMVGSWHHMAMRHSLAWVSVDLPFVSLHTLVKQNFEFTLVDPKDCYSRSRWAKILCRIVGPSGWIGLAVFGPRPSGFPTISPPWLP